MSNVSNIVDALAALVEANLGTAYTRLADTYFIERNSDLMLAQGYGISYGPAERVELTLGTLAYRRVFSVLLTRVVGATNHDFTLQDTTSKAVLEDLHTLRSALETSNSTLGGYAISARYENDGGLSPVSAENGFRFYALILNLSVLYHD